MTAANLAKPKELPVIKQCSARTEVVNSIILCISNNAKIILGSLYAFGIVLGAVSGVIKLGPVGEGLEGSSVKKIN